MNDYCDDEIFPSFKDKDAHLFDDLVEIPVSGNIDPLDRVKHVCLSCGCINGNHTVDCTEDL